MADRAGLPLAVCVICAAAARPHEVTLVAPTLVAPTLDSRFVAELPQRLIGDRSYDADPLDAALAEPDVEMIAPHRRNRMQPKTPDGCPLRRYYATTSGAGRWSGASRGAATSSGWSSAMSATRESSLGVVHLGCVLILLRQRGAHDR